MSFKIFPYWAQFFSAFGRELRLAVHLDLYHLWPVQMKHSRDFSKMIFEDSVVSVESVRQLIETTRKNRRLTKQNEKFLNESAAWYEEKSFLEKQVHFEANWCRSCAELHFSSSQFPPLAEIYVLFQIKEGEATAESLRNELRVRCISQFSLLACPNSLD